MIEVVLEPVVTVIDLVGAGILVVGFAESLILAVRARLAGTAVFLAKMAVVRCRLGTYLLLGLEFLIASDIISTIIHPTQEELLAVALLVAIRIAIGYFLGKELAEVRAESAD